METTPALTVDALHNTPIGRAVDKHQSDGHDVYIFGFSANGRYALVVDVEQETVSVASVHTCNGLGRWECSKLHLSSNMDLYMERYPVR